VPPHRDVAAFEQRAARYEEGWIGRLHHQVADETAALARSVSPAPARVLDVGCGTGYLLRLLARQWPEASELAGLDPAPSMIEAAAASADDPRLRFSVGTAERLPFPDGSFDLVVTTTSFDHWSDQQAGLRECARVLAPGGHPHPRRRVLALAHSHAGRRPSREGENPVASQQAAQRGRVHLPRLARRLRHHQGRDRDTAIPLEQSIRGDVRQG
jgi:ubiquinone/menaquinone biosynthesis C-methylase UbiE